MSLRLCFLLLLLSFVPSAFAVAADIVYRNGNIYTVDDIRPRASVLVIKAGRIIALGDEQDIAPYVGAQTKVIDLAGAFVMPGFIDSHAHILNIGRAQLNLRLLGTKSWQEVIDQVSEGVQQVPKGTWILGRGWHQEKWLEPVSESVAGFPVHDALSLVSPDHPVLLEHASGHAILANQKAMSLAGVTSDTEDPAGGEILHKPSGEPSGVFTETAEALIYEAYQQSRQNLGSSQIRLEKERFIQLTMKECLANGITTLQDAGSDHASISLLRI